MALIACKECGHQVSTDAEHCPQCGARLKPKSQAWKWALGVPAGLVALFLMWGASIPAYEGEARRARKLCEQAAALTGGSMHACDAAYVEALRRGKQGHGGSKAGCPAEAPDCSWGK